MRDTYSLCGIDVLLVGLAGFEIRAKCLRSFFGAF